MNRRWRETFLMWTESDEYKSRVAEAISIIKQAFGKYQKPYCSFSGGKDSLVMTHIVTSLKPDVDVITLDYSRTFVPLRYLIEIKEIAKKLSWNHQVIRSKILESSPNDGLPVMLQVLNYEVTPYLLKKGFDVVFVGLRKEESKWRELRIRNNKRLTKLPEVYPIAEFSWMDIWAYIISQELPYLSIYDKYGNIMGWENVRFSTLFDRELDAFGNSNIDGFFSYRYRFPKK